ncbi:MAG TPA: hypothetical protein VIJ79_18525 [Acidobacteriaceae bacterium]
MKKQIIATAILALTFSASAFGETYKGFVSDKMCSTKHKADDKADIECAKRCLKGGEPAMFVVDGKVYKIDNPDAIKDHIGTTITVDGKLTGDSIHIDKIS